MEMSPAERYLSVEAVRSQIKSVQRKLRVNSQIAAVARARADGWFERSDSERHRRPA